MKKSIIRLMSALLICTLMLGLCACSVPPVFERLQRKMSVSFDNIICQFSTTTITTDPLYSGSNGDYPLYTNIAFYADNTVRIWLSRNTRNYNIYSAFEQTTAQITDEQKNQLIETIKSNLLDVEYYGTSDVYTGKWSKIFLYDANGNKVHSCGGYRPNHPSFNAVVSLIRLWFPSNDVRITSLEKMLPFNDLFSYVRSETGDMSVTGNTYVFTIDFGSVWTESINFSQPVVFDYSYTMLPDGNLEVTSTAWAEIEGYGTTEKREVRKIIELTSEQTDEFIELLLANFDDGDFYPADENRTEILKDYCSRGRLFFYDSEGNHIYTHYSNSDHRASEFDYQLNKIEFSLWSDYSCAAIPLVEEDIISILG